MRVSPAAIRDAASGIRQTAQSFDAQVQAFLSRVEGLREPPGNDMVSPLIWAAHDAVLTAATRCFSSNTATLHGHADGLDVTADGYEGAERVNTFEINRVRETLG